MKLLHATLAASLGLAMLAGCGGSTGSKAGGDAPPLTLRIGTDDTPERPSAGQIKEYARQVSALSGGRMRIEPVWLAGGSGRDDWDQVIARMVRRGDLDLALVPSRAWDTEGVTSLRALSAPFLVTSDELVDRIVRSDLRPDLLAGLDAADVVGLGLWPEGLRHPFAFHRPLLEPADFTGATIRAPRSDVTEALFRTLGAKADFGDGSFGAAVAEGRVAAADTSFAWSVMLPAASTATSNITFYPKVNTLVADDGAYRELSAEQRRILREAADRITTWASEHRLAEPDGAKQFCRGGGTVVHAPDAALRALEQRALPVYTSLERNPATKSLIQRIRRLKAALPSAPILAAPCRPSGATPPAAVPPPTSGFPEGVYRSDVPANPVLDPSFPGINTLTFKGGRWRHDPPGGGPCEGTYTVDEGRIAVSLGTAECGHPAGTVIFTAQWRIQNRDLRFIDVRSDVDGVAFAQAAWGSSTWTRIK